MIDLEQRYDHILRQHGGALRRVAGAYEADLARREDLLQEICLAIWQALPSFRGEASERTFVFRIAHNRGLSHGWRRRPVETELAEEMADAGRDPEADAAAAQRRQRLADAIRSLPLGLRQVVTLSLEGCSYKEISEVLGISESNVGVRLNRGKKALRDMLGGGR